MCIWKTKQFSFGGNNLTNLNYRNIGDQVKFIDTLKYYQQSLPALAAAIISVEKIRIKKLNGKFLESRDYSDKFWFEIEFKNCNNILEMVASGKGTITYEKIRNFHILDLMPKNGVFYEKNKFVSELKDQVITDSEFEDMKFLYKIL